VQGEKDPLLVIAPILMWHTQDSQGHILALASTEKVLSPFKVFPLRSTKVGARTRMLPIVRAPDVYRGTSLI